ncbi:MAG: hypothetical protein IJK40_08620 [Clostridia bacterium]|nr:hypothetical protein [Clostridia bacterium]
MRRVFLFCGHYGSGKTNLAVNLACRLKEQGGDVAIADLDIVNPYFRTVDSRDALTERGIDVYGLPFANTNVDLPSLPSEIYGLVQTHRKLAVMDIGGDERGVLALGRFAPYILEENDYEMYFVVNFYRPLTRTPEEALAVFREITEATPLRFTGIVNNSNLGAETTAPDVEATVSEAAALADLTGLPLVYTSYSAALSPAPAVPSPMPLRLQKKLF